MHDWTSIKLLESATNLKSVLKSLTGRSPSTSIAREVGVCLQQGRLFYESADQSELEIRPLLLFYGTMAFAKAVIVGRTLRSLATIPQSHGVRDASTPSARIAELVVRTWSDGTFQRFNDVVRDLNSLDYFVGSMTQKLLLPTALAVEIGECQISLDDILSRIPGIETLYRQTFHVPAKVEHLTTISPSLADPAHWELRIDDRDLFRDRAELKRLIRKWRDRFPLLERWRVMEAVHAWGHSLIRFDNVAVPPGEMDEECLVQTDNDFAAHDRPSRNRNTVWHPIEQLIGNDGGSLAGGGYLISPLNGIYFSKFSLHYLGMFALSSLVRYRPQSWVHAISRSVTVERASDDQALTLFETFMQIHATEIPALVSLAFQIQ